LILAIYPSKSVAVVSWDTTTHQSYW